ncbi:MAG: porphobilinogen deaminase [Halobacteriales archaeon SW_9_67_25]|nr:MAG: porphobilinogen deaminase [Halobacteriales archaeon SW_9_67_25]
MNARGRTVRVGTRGSELALRQAATVKEALERRRLSVELVEVETRGDQLRDELIHRLGTTGAFVRALDEEVLSGDLDAAVHSMKDVPTDQPEGLVVAGIPERGPAADLLVTPLAGLRGNVDTRVEKLLAPTLQREHEARLEAENEANGTGETDDGQAGDRAGEDEDSEGGEYERTVEEWFDALAEIERRALERAVDTEYDAICLAEAGVTRSGLDHHVPHVGLDPAEFVPAPGQGALAVTAVDGNLAGHLHEILDHPPTRVAVTVERTVLAELGGGCVAPMGVHARLQGEVVLTAVSVLARDADRTVTATRELPVERHAEAATAFAADLADRGAAELIEEAKRDGPDGAKRQ